jgi:DNA-binding CsgD family transcriptional regulator
MIDEAHIVMPATDIFMTVRFRFAGRPIDGSATRYPSETMSVQAEEALEDGVATLRLYRTAGAALWIDTFAAHLRARPSPTVADGPCGPLIGVSDDHALLASAETPALLIAANAPLACEIASRQARARNAPTAILSQLELHTAVDAIAGLMRGFSITGARARDEAAKLPAFTRRNALTLTALASGASNKVIATRLDLSLATVKREIDDLTLELGMESRLDLALQALRWGFGEVDSHDMRVFR